MRRRSFLSALGATVLAGNALLDRGDRAERADVPTPSTGRSDDYRTITVPAGEWRLISVGSGETLENVLIDMTARGASAQINAVGRDWRIRNVGFRGVHPGGNFLVTPAAAEGSTCTIENVYLGDGQRARTTQGGIWVRSDHHGTLNWRNVNVQRFVDNGLYGTNSSRDNGGVVNVYDSYFRSNNNANVRLGTADGTCRVENTVSVGTPEVPRFPDDVPGYAKQCRGVWAWWGRVVVSNCDIDVAPSVGVNLVTSHLNPQAARAEIVTENTRLGPAANRDPPDGVPLSAEDAARGLGWRSSKPTPPGRERPVED